MVANLGFRFAPPQALRYRRAPRANQTDDELDQGFLKSGPRSVLPQSTLNGLAA